MNKKILKEVLNNKSVRDIAIGEEEGEEKFARKCDECGKGMNEGYVIDAGAAYYCSDECLHKHFTEEEWTELYDDGNSESYWTEWDPEDEEAEKTKDYSFLKKSSYPEGISDVGLKFDPKYIDQTEIEQYNKSGQNPMEYYPADLCSKHAKVAEKSELGRVDAYADPSGDCSICGEPATHQFWFDPDSEGEE